MRRKRDCIVKRIYDQYTPYIQLIGFVILCTFTAGMNWSKVSDYESRITKLEAFQETTAPQIAHIDQKLDDLIAFWNVPHKE